MIAQTGGPGFGDILNLVGIGILFIAAFHYIQYRQGTPSEKQEARRNFTITLLVFLFYAVVSYIYWGQADSWVIQIGQSVDLYFEQMAQNLTVIGETTAPSDEQSRLDTLLNGIRTIGLIAYVLLFGAAAVAGKAPVKIINALFN